MRRAFSEAWALPGESPPGGGGERVWALVPEATLQRLLAGARPEELWDSPTEAKSAWELLQALVGDCVWVLLDAVQVEVQEP